jgi:acyl-CoA thioesterase-1
MKKNELSAPIHITFFGDSIFVGQGVSIYHGWVAQMSKYIDDYGREVGRNFLVVNSSANGRTTRQALEDMPYAIQSHRIHILIVQLGLNDCNYWETDKGGARVSAGAYKENLREIIMRGFRAGAYRVLLNNNHPTTRDINIFPHTEITYEDSNKQYCELAKELAADFNDEVIFLDIHAYFTEQLRLQNKPMKHYLHEDGLHLNRAGHEEYLRKMKPVIFSTIDKFISSEDEN